MAFNYDFDIHWVFPRALFADAKIGQFLEDVGMAQNSHGNYVALFRDPALVDAIKNADAKFKEFMTASGFGFDTFNSGAPVGFYPKQDEAARKDIIARLTENLSKYEIKSANGNGFEWAAFLDAVVSAKPIEMKSAPAPLTAERVEDDQPVSAPNLGPTVECEPVMPQAQLAELAARPRSLQATMGIRIGLLIVATVGIGIASQGSDWIAEMTSFEVTTR